MQKFYIFFVILPLCFQLNLSAQEVLVVTESQSWMTTWQLLSTELGLNVTAPSWSYYLNSLTEDDVQTISNKLWANVEKQLMELDRKQETLQNRFDACKRILRVEELNSRKFAELEETTETDPYGYNAMQTMKQDLSILKAFQNQLSSLRVSREDKSDISRTIIQSFNKSFRSNVPVPIFGATEACTPDNTDYKFYRYNGTTNEFHFVVAAKNDVHVALTSGPMVRVPMYEFVIGGWGNSKSVVRKDHGQDVVEAATNGIVNPCENRGFWVRWNNNGVQAGYAGDKKPFIQYNQGPQYQVKYIGIHTGFGSTGNWLLHND